MATLKPRHLITLTTDFGLNSPYVAQMKAAIYAVASEVTLVDITHGISPQNILEGAIVLQDTCRYFPAGTVHVAVVDPGVGTQRPLIAAQLGEHYFVGPDNGLLSLWAEEVPPQQIVVLDQPQFWRSQVSRTFHGRDIMAPVAAHLAQGVPLLELGTPSTTWTRLPWPQPRWQSDRVQGEVVLVDHFGNLLTNIREADLTARGLTAVSGWLDGRFALRLVRTYGDAEPGTLVGLFSSQGRFEVAVVCGSAAAQCGVGRGATVVLHTVMRP